MAVFRIMTAVMEETASMPEQHSREGASDGSKARAGVAPGSPQAAANPARAPAQQSSEWAARRVSSVVFRGGPFHFGDEAVNFRAGARTALRNCLYRVGCRSASACRRVSADG